MSFTGQFNFGYPITSQNIITNIPNNAVLPLTVGSSLKGNILGITFETLKSQVGGAINVYDTYGNPPIQTQNIRFEGQGWNINGCNLPAGPGACISLNLATINGNSILGGGNIVAGLPSFLEYDESNRTFWNNGKGDQTTNLSYGPFALQANTSGYQNIVKFLQVAEVN